MKKIILFSLLVILIFIIGCAQQEIPTEKPTEKIEQKQQLPNPASVYCEEQGGKLEIRESAAGTAGYCILPDGTECEEWAYYRGECPKAKEETKTEEGGMARRGEQTQSTNPIDELSDETIQKWKANCKDKFTIK